MTVVARLGGLTFDGGDGKTLYSIRSLKGWFAGGVGTRRDSEERPADHGLFDAPGYLTGRLITIEGLIQADTVGQYESAVSRLQGLLAGGGSSRMVVSQYSGETFADVARYGEPDVTPLVWGRVAEYQIQLLAANPRRFGRENTFTLPGEVYHYGNFDADVEFTVTGSGTYSLSALGETFTVSSAISGGQTDRINLRDATVTRNGVLLDEAVSEPGYWTIPAGVPVGVSVSGSVAVSAVVRDTLV